MILIISDSSIDKKKILLWGNIWILNDTTQNNLVSQAQAGVHIYI